MCCHASRRLQMEPSSFAFHNLLHTILLKQKRDCREQSGATHPIGGKSLLPAADRSMPSIPIHRFQGEQQSYCVPYLSSRNSSDAAVYRPNHLSRSIYERVSNTSSPMYRMVGFQWTLYGCPNHPMSYSAKPSLQHCSIAL